MRSGTPDTFYHYSESSRVELIVSNRAGREYPWHVHARHWTFGMVCSGEAVLETRAGQSKLTEGGSFVVPPNVAHALRTAPETTLAVLCLDPDKMGEDCADLIENMLGLTPEHPLAGELPSRHLSSLRELAAQLPQQHPEGHPEPAAAPRIQAVMKLLQNSPEEQFSLEYLASLAGYSPWHFLRLFQKESGMTPHAYQLVCRLRMLRALLRAGATAAEAAVAAGFSDQSHMHKLFKLHHGLTPKQFRQACFRRVDTTS